MNDRVKQDLIRQWVRPEIRALSAYHVPDPGDLIKLDAMENPYTWPADLIEQWSRVISSAPLNRYPDPSAHRLKQALRRSMSVPPEMEIILGNGSDELIQMIAMALSDTQGDAARTVMAPEPSFVMYKMIATFTNMEYVGIPLAPDFSLELPTMLTAIEQHQPAVIFLAYPNNPTGNLFDEQTIDAIIAASPGLVVIDEAYHAFAGASYMNKLTQFDNVVVMRTVSKMGLAGLRLGLLAGPAAWLNEFDKVRLPYNINVLTQISAEFALQHQDVLDRQTQQICTDRETLLQQLSACANVTAFPSRANFVLLRVPSGRAPALFEALKQQGVLVKNLHGSSELLRDCLRVTVGTPEENATFLVALKAEL
jgi:histidinol-phosphate aminotransferase